MMVETEEDFYSRDQQRHFEAQKQDLGRPRAALKISFMGEPIVLTHGNMRKVHTFVFRKSRWMIFLTDTTSCSSVKRDLYASVEPASIELRAAAMM